MKKEYTLKQILHDKLTGWWKPVNREIKNDYTLLVIPYECCGGLYQEPMDWTDTLQVMEFYEGIISPVHTECILDCDETIFWEKTKEPKNIKFNI